MKYYYYPKDEESFKRLMIHFQEKKYRWISGRKPTGRTIEELGVHYSDGFFILIDEEYKTLSTSENFEYYIKEKNVTEYLYKKSNKANY